jgi:hypothetical protein
MRRNEERDQQIVREMWTQANNEPLTLGSLQAFGFVDRERYRRYVDGLILELVLDKDPRSDAWSYELAILAPDGGQVDDALVRYWLEAFFGREAAFAAKRNYMLTADARYTFPFQRRRF